ncbi:MAG TPA: alpha/beta hydrolase [Trebonia sp.]|nr:alpha/beta hydrolase [Trebonia sp.]
MTSTMVRVDGGEVWADDSGGDGPPLVLLHPGVGDSGFWAPVLPALTAAYRVIRYDARGFGRSPAPTVKYTLYDDLVAVLDHYGLDRVAIAGCSQGGGTGLVLAVEQPERLAALVLLCPGVPGYPWADEPGRDAEHDRAAAAGDVDALAAYMGKVWAAGAGGITPEVLGQLRSAARADLAIGDLKQPGPPAWDRLESVGVPTALVVGDADYPPLVEVDKLAAARIPGCELTVVPGMDHLPALREPALVTRVITQTLGRAAGW